MKNYTFCTLLSMLTFFVPHMSEAEMLERDFRVRPSHDNLTLICRARNISDEVVSVSELTYPGNAFRGISLDEAARRRYWLRKPSASRNPLFEGNPRYRIRPDELKQWESNIEDVFVIYSMIQGPYVLLNWYLRARPTQYICLGLPAEDGNIRPPVVDPDNPDADVYFGFIYREEGAPEVCFLFLNGTAETIVIEKPLTQGSRIVISAPAIDYTRDLVIVNAEVEETVVESGTVGEWRLPWQTVFDLIPKEDVEKIKAAGGDLDLVWKVGEYESDPLPISLADPVGANTH